MELKKLNFAERGNPALRRQGTLNILALARQSLDALRVRTEQEAALAAKLARLEEQDAGFGSDGPTIIQEEIVQERGLRKAA